MMLSRLFFFRYVSIVAVCAALSGCTQGSLAALEMPVWMKRQQAAPAQSWQPLQDAAAESAAPVGTRTVYCSAAKGAAQFSRGWYDFEQADFTMTDSRPVHVPLSRKFAGKDVMVFQATFDHAGQKMIFCPVVEGPPKKRIACSSLYMLDDDLSMGIRRTFDIPEAIRGASITCADNPSHLVKL